MSNTLVMSSTDGDLYKFEDGNQLAGSNAMVTIERIGLDIGNTTDVHLVKTIYPYIEGGSVNIHIGSQMSPNDSVSWDGPYAFDPSTDYKVDVRKTGRLHAIRFTSTANVQWALRGYGLEVELVGTR